ncbi:MAG: hypothetical protein ACP5I8_10850 [Phycisphaerae bacterium]
MGSGPTFSARGTHFGASRRISWLGRKSRYAAGVTAQKGFNTMARTPKLGRTFTRRRVWFLRTRPRLKLPGKKARVVSFLPGHGSPARSGGTAERLLGWVMSLLVHVVALFVFVLAIRLLTKAPAAPPLPFIMPQSFLSGHQLTALDKPPSSAIRRMTIKHLLGTRQAAKLASATALSAMLNGTTPDTHLFAISLGQGSQFSASSNGYLGAMGMPGKTVGGMPAISFFGVRARAKRVVFLVDHAGRMVGHLYLLKREVQRSIRHLLPFQRFAVIEISAKYKILGPDKLLRASPANRAMVLPEVHKMLAENRDYGQLLPFLRPFKVAWAMHPQVIFFLTDGYVDPRLIADLRQLNAQYPIRVYTFTFMGDNLRHQKNLRKIAAATGGKFMYLSPRLLERRSAAGR